MQEGFKMLDSKAGPQPFPKLPKFCTYCFSHIHHRWIVLKFGDSANRVPKFKKLNSKAGHRVGPEPPKFCLI